MRERKREPGNDEGWARGGKLFGRSTGLRRNYRANRHTPAQLVLLLSRDQA